MISPRPPACDRGSIYLKIIPEPTILETNASGEPRSHFRSTAPASEFLRRPQSLPFPVEPRHDARKRKSTPMFEGSLADAVVGAWCLGVAVGAQRDARVVFSLRQQRLPVW